MDYETLALLLMVAGFALIVAEIFIPSGGLILILCVIAFASSIWFAHKAWWGSSPGYFWTYLGSLVVLIPGAVIGTFRALERTEFGKRILLAAPDPESLIPYQEETAHLNELIGCSGEALTLMAPGGMVRVQGERLHALSEGVVIQSGETIEVIGFSGTRVVVRPAIQGGPVSRLDSDRKGQPDKSVWEDEPPEIDESDSDQPPLDFDLPSE